MFLFLCKPSGKVLIIKKNLSSKCDSFDYKKKLEFEIVTCQVHRTILSTNMCSLFRYMCLEHYCLLMIIFKILSFDHVREIER